MKNGHNGNGHKPTQREIQKRIDKAVALADRSLGVYSVDSPRNPVRGAAASDPGAPAGASRVPIIPTASFDPIRSEGNWAPFRPVPLPVPGIVPGFQPGADVIGESQWGGTGTPITSGFLVDLGEYNQDLYGRSSVQVYEKMRRGDAQVWGTLMAVKGPLQSATWDVGPGVKSNDKGYAKAKEVADFVKDNIMGGLEFQTSTGGWHSQAWDQVIWNALLCLDFGCSIHEDVFRVDGNFLKLRALTPLLPITYYRWHTESDGYTLISLEQYGYRGIEFINATIPAEKICRFTLNQEGSNFWGLSLLRSAYPHWYIKNQLYRIDALAAERNGLGVPVVTLPPGPSAQDRATAYNFVTKLSAHEMTGLVLPNEAKFEIQAVVGTPRDLQKSIEHHNRMISTTALAMFMTIGSTPHGNRANAATQHDFFLAASQHLATYIAKRLTQTTVRRLTWLNFGPDAIVPEVIAKNVKMRDFEDVREALQSLSTAGLLVSDEPLRNLIRGEYELPEETDQGVVTNKGEQVVGEGQEVPVAGAAGPGGAAGPSGTQKTPPAMTPGNKNQTQQAKAGKGNKGKSTPNKPVNDMVQATELSAHPLHKRLVWHGLNVSIENQAGSVRKGKDPTRPWEVTMTHDYGYLRQTEGVDGDHVDCFMGPDHKATQVYVVHTMKAPQFTDLDEDKCFLDFESESAARAAFFENYDTPEHFGYMETLTVGDFIDKVLATKEDPKLIHATDADGGYRSIGDDPGITISNNRSGQPTQRREKKKNVVGPPADSAQEMHPASPSPAIGGAAPTKRGVPQPVKDLMAKQAAAGARIISNAQVVRAREGFKPSASQERKVSPMPEGLQPNDRQDTPLNPTPDPTPVVKETFSEKRRVLFQEYHGDEVTKKVRDHYDGHFQKLLKQIQGPLKSKVIASVAAQAARQLKAKVPVPQLHFTVDPHLVHLVAGLIEDMHGTASEHAKSEVKK